MRSRFPLPAQFDGMPFGVTAARLAGARRSRMDAVDLARPHYGARTPIAIPDEMIERCRRFAPVMPSHQFFSHTTAAALWQIPLPRWIERAPLHVSSPLGRREPRESAIAGHRLRIPSSEVVTIHGIKLTSPAETWAQLGGMMPLEDLVAAGDFIIGRGALASPERLSTAIGRLRRRGAVDLREAVERLDPGAESSPESRLRIRLVNGGLPAPEVQWVLRDASGAFVARLDLGYPRYKVAVEYDGRHHAEGDQFRHDADRWHAIEQQGWIMVRVLAHHMAGHTAVMRTRQALLARGWKPSPPAG